MSLLLESSIKLAKTNCFGPAGPLESRAYESWPLDFPALSPSRFLRRVYVYTHAVRYNRHPGTILTRWLVRSVSFAGRVSVLPCGNIERSYTRDSTVINRVLRGIMSSRRRARGTTAAPWSNRPSTAPGCLPLRTYPPPSQPPPPPPSIQPHPHRTSNTPDAERFVSVHLAAVACHLSSSLPTPSDYNYPPEPPSKCTVEALVS